MSQKKVDQSADTSNPGPGALEDTDDPLTIVDLDRRTFLKSATTGGLAATAGYGPAATRTSLSPIGRSQAIAPVVVGAFAIGAATGIAYRKYSADTDDPDTSTSDVLEDSLYNAGLTVSEGRSTFETEMQTQYLDRPDGQSPYANAAWSEVRAAAAKEAVNGNGQAAAEQTAADALDLQTRVALTNIIERWNTGVSSLLSHFKADFDNSAGVFSISNQGSSGGIDAYTLGEQSEFDRVDPTTSSGGYIAVKYTATDLPGDPSDLDQQEADPGIFYVGGPSPNFCGPAPGVFGLPSEGQNPVSSWKYRTSDFTATHSNLSNQLVLDGYLYRDVLDQIQTEYSSITSDLSTYVGNLVSALDQGAIEASDIYSPRDLAEQFASSSKRSRVAAELAAAGAQVPEDSSYEAKISHPDLSVSELWCDLYVQFGDGSATPIEPGITIAAADYELAYIGYTSAASGDYITETLSGESDLEVLDATGFDNEDPVDTAADSAESSGAVNLGSDPVDQIQNPGDYDDTYNLVLETESSGLFTVSLSDVTQDGEDYVIPETASPLSGGETLTVVRVVPVADQQQTSTYVADPTSVDSQQVQDAIQAQKDMADEIDKMNSGGGGGGILPSGLLDWDLFGIPGSIVAAGAAVGGAYLWMDDEDGRSRNAYKNRGNNRNR